MSVLTGFSTTVIRTSFKSTFKNTITRSYHILESNTRSPKRIENVGLLRYSFGGIERLSKSSRVFHDYRQHSNPKLSADEPALIPKEKQKNRITLFRAGEEDSQSISSFEELRPSLDRLVQQSKSIKDDGESPFVWLDITDPSKNEIKEIGHAFSLHRLTVEDVVEAETREKMEEYDSYTFVVYGSFDSDPKSQVFLEPVTMYIIVFPGGIVSMHAKPQAVTKRVRDRLVRLQHRRKITSEWILYALLDEATDAFNEATRPLKDAIRYFTTNLTQGIKGIEDSRTLLQKFGETHQRVLQLRELIGSKGDVIKKLIQQHKLSENNSRSNDKSPGLNEYTLHYSDVEDHLIAFTNTLTRLEEALLQSEGHCLTQLNIQMMHASQESNDAISKLTILSTVILPLNVVTGLWGMNVTVPGQDQGTLIWFYSLVGAMSIIASTGFWWAMRFLRKPKRS